jgi:hypothetical protein
VWDVLGSDPVNEAPHLFDDDYENQNLEVESVCLFSKVQTFIATIQKYLKQRTSNIRNSIGIL